MAVAPGVDVPLAGVVAVAGGHEDQSAGCDEEVDRGGESATVGTSPTAARDPGPVLGGVVERLGGGRHPDETGFGSVVVRRVPHLQGHDPDAVAGRGGAAVSEAARGARDAGPVVVHGADDAGTVGSVSVEVSWVVVGAAAVLARPAAEAVEGTRDEVVADDVVHETVAVVVDAGRSVRLGLIAPHVAVRGSEIRCVGGGARQVRVVPLDTGVQHRDHDRGITGLHVPRLGRVDVGIIGLREMPAVREVGIVGRRVHRVNADQLRVPHQRMGEGEGERALESTGNDGGVDPDHVVVGEVGASVLRRHRRVGELRSDRLRPDQLQQGGGLGRSVSKHATVRAARGDRASSGPPEFDHQLVRHDQIRRGVGIRCDGDAWGRLTGRCGRWNGRDGRGADADGEDRTDGGLHGPAPEVRVKAEAFDSGWGRRGMGRPSRTAGPKGARGRRGVKWSVVGGVDVVPRDSR